MILLSGGPQKWVKKVSKNGQKVSFFGTHFWRSWQKCQKLACFRLNISKPAKNGSKKGLKKWSFSDRFLVVQRWSGYPVHVHAGCRGGCASLVHCTRVGTLYGLDGCPVPGITVHEHWLQIWKSGGYTFSAMNLAILLKSGQNRWLFFEVSGVSGKTGKNGKNKCLSGIKIRVLVKKCQKWRFCPIFSDFVRFSWNLTKKTIYTGPNPRFCAKHGARNGGFTRFSANLSENQENPGIWPVIWHRGGKISQKCAEIVTFRHISINSLTESGPTASARPAEVQLAHFSDFMTF